MRFLPAGDRAVLVELDSLAEVHRLHRAVRAAGIAIDSVPGWSTLLVTTDGEVGRLVNQLRGLGITNDDEPAPRKLHEIPVVYDGEDLEAVGHACGCSGEDVVRLHSSVDYLVAFLGFSRGFPYLSGLHPALHLPRRATPRARVDAGSVAIARDQCGIYPVASPGGWHLLGRTSRRLFDPQAEPPTVLSPGDRVRFIRVAERR